ncbi:MAG: HD domain-containing protein [Atopobiaceae bacterium]|nr:HD domain-containing protein [Atopobiaceae bacterium]
MSNQFNTDTRLAQQLSFILEIDKAKYVLRQTYLTGKGRRENDAEHSWHLAVMAYLLAEYSNEPIDVAKAMLMCLVHDIVEIQAGDTFAFDEEGKKSQAEREERAKQQLFSLLPDDQAQALMKLFDEFVANETAEAHFVHAMDNLQPLLLNDSNDGISWVEHGVTVDQMYARHNKTKLGSEQLFELTDALIKKHAQLGHLIEK